MKLRCKDLKASYRVNGSREEVLRKVSLETSSGEFLTILGPSGCGKTTFLQTIVGVVRPDSGRVDLVPAFPGETAHPLLIRPRRPGDG